MERFARLRSGTWVRQDGATWIGLTDAPWSGGVDSGTRHADVALAAPVAPSKVICFARTYPKHAAELGNAVPAQPLMFLKPPSAIIGPGQPIRLPDVGRCDPEGELAVVMGRRLVDGTREDAVAAVFGFTVLNDVSARVLQRGDGTWARGKGFDTFCPVGPHVVTGIDPLDLAVHTAVDGDIRARGRTSEMTFDAYELVAWASRVMTLEPGDVISTGTPPGVQAIEPGNVVEVVVESVGTLSNPVERRR